STHRPALPPVWFPPRATRRRRVTLRADDITVGPGSAERIPRNRGGSGRDVDLEGGTGAGHLNAGLPGRYEQGGTRGQRERGPTVRHRQRSGRTDHDPWTGRGQPRHVTRDGRLVEHELPYRYRPGHHAGAHRYRSAHRPVEYLE